MSKRKMCRYQCGRPVENPTTTRCRTCRRKDKKAGKAHRHAIAPGGPKILMIDIETAPNLVYTWGLWNQNIGLNQIVEKGRMLCFAAKWLGADDTMFFSEHSHGRVEMIHKAHELLDRADVVVHYYGSRFDVPWLNSSFLEAGLTPPRPFKQVDLKQAVSKRFKFPSNKLEFVSQVLGFAGKVKHEGFDLWRQCMAGDADAWGRMETYNVRDVTLLEEVYEALLPWIPGVPSRHLYNGSGDCPRCGADSVRPSGLYRTPLSAFQQYSCGACGSHFRDSKRITGVNIQDAAL